MGYKLRDDEIDWLQFHHPGLIYDSDRSIILGRFDFTSRYCNYDEITDSYEIFINLNTITGLYTLPEVREISGRIIRMAKILGISPIDLHTDYDGGLCLIRPDKIKIHYPYGFEFRRFMNNLSKFFYWVSFRYRYGYEPWPGEKHGWTE